MLGIMPDNSPIAPLVPPAEVLSVLHEFNPWWTGSGLADVPRWSRAAFGELVTWLIKPPAQRAALLTGARQIGKTTLLLQAARALLDRGIRPDQIIYATFDHPILKLLGPDEVLRLWRQVQPSRSSTEPEYLLLDEIQNIPGWTTWLKHQTDFQKRRRIAATGSAMPLGLKDQESGVGRWHAIRLPTLSFYEYLQIKQVEIPSVESVASLTELFSWLEGRRLQASEMARPLVAHFHEYLLRGGFPQTAQVESIATAQRLLREDIVDRVLKRDMTALYGVRRVLELEKLFLYLCLHDGGILDVQTVATNLSLNRSTVNQFISLLEAAHLIYTLRPLGYGKEVLRARHKVYLADAAIAGSVLLRGRGLLSDSTRLGAAVETAFFKHLFTRLYQISVGFSYWRSKRDHEVDIVSQISGNIVPFEIKYAGRGVTPSDFKALRQLHQVRPYSRGYLITRDLHDFGPSSLEGVPGETVAGQQHPIMRIPAPLACYWLSRAEPRSPEESAP